MDPLVELVRTAPMKWWPHEMSPKQLRFISLGCIEALYGGAVGGGKSDCLLREPLGMIDKPGFHALLLRRTYRDLALDGAIMDRSHEWLRDTPARWSHEDKRWTFPSGSTISFGYLDGPRDHHRYQGGNWQYVGFDELSQFKEEQYEYLFSRIRNPGGQHYPLKMRGATNPGDIGHDWIQKRWNIPETIDFDRVYEHDGRWFVPARLEDNPGFTETEREKYDESLSQLGNITYQQMREGRWVRDPSGLVYSSFDPRRNCIDALPNLPDGEHWTYVLGADFGVTDPTAFAVWAFCDYDPVAYVAESEQWAGLSPSDAADIYWDWSKRYGGFERTIGDIGGLGKAFAQEWHRRHHIPVQPAQKTDKLGYIKLFNGECERELIKAVRPKNEEAVRDLMSLPWKDETHQKEHPDLPNHLPDAWLYSWRDVRAWQAIERPIKREGMDARVEEVRARKEKLMERQKRRLGQGGDFDPDNEWSSDEWTD